VRWLQHLQSKTAERLAQTGLSRRVLRHLIFTHNTGIGSKILDVGCGSGELVLFFNQLGFKATGVDESVSCINQARKLAPNAPFHCTMVDETIPSFDPPYDLAIVRAHEPYVKNLFTAGPLRTTANLLSLVRPGGHLVFVVQQDVSAQSQDPMHARDCYVSHLSAFPGMCTFTEFPNASPSHEPLKWVFGQRPGSSVLTVTLQLTAQERPRNEWLCLADAYSLSKTLTCCDESRARAHFPHGGQQAA
jgi:SAM-dependent methyltransferase